MRTRLSIPGTALLAILLAGCSQPAPTGQAGVDAPADSVEDALRAYLAEDRLCFDVGDSYNGLTALPGRLEAGSGKTTPALDEVLKSQRKWAALQEAGLVTLAIVDGERTRANGEKTPQAYMTIELTELGQQAYRLEPGRGFGDSPGFCYAGKTLGEITRQSEPRTAADVTVVKTEYTYTLGDWAAWARNPAVAATVPEVRRALQQADQPQRGSGDVIRTADGWMHAALANRRD